MAKNCPDRRRLLDFAVGKLDDSSFEFVAAHLEKCTDCQSSITELAEDQDTLAPALRKIAADPAASVDPVMRKAMMAAAKITPGSQVGKAESSIVAGSTVVSVSFAQFVKS